MKEYYPNLVTQQALLKSLDPDNKDIFVTKQDLYGDGIKVWEIKKYTVTNAQNTVVFEYKNERLESSSRRTLKVKDIVISYDTKDVCFNFGPIRGFDCFVDTLEEALKQKLAIQEYEKQYKQAKQNMSIKDRQIMRYLHDTLQR